MEKNNFVVAAKLLLLLHIRYDDQISIITNFSNYSTLQQSIFDGIEIILIS